MDEFGRSHGVFHHFKGHVHHLAPIPVFMRRFEGSEIDSLNTGLLQVATRSLTKERREVPDVRHVNTLGSVPRLPDDTWAETHTTAVGVPRSARRICCPGPWPDRGGLYVGTRGYGT